MKITFGLRKRVTAAALRSLVLSLILLSHVSASAHFIIQTVEAAKPGYFEARIAYPQFTDRSVLARLASRTVEAWAKEELNRWVRRTEESVKETGRPRTPNQYSASSEVTFYSSRLISVWIGIGEFQSGAAHPAPSALAFNFGVIDGKARRLVLGDLFRPGADYRRLIDRLLIAKLREYRARDVVEGRITTFDEIRLNDFVVARDGLAYQFLPGELASYSEGGTCVILTFRELGRTFRRELSLRPVAATRPWRCE